MKKIFRILILLYLSAGSGVVHSQAITWEKVLDYTNSSLEKAQQTSDNGFIAIGYNRIGSFGKIILVKLNEYGDTLWNKYYDLSVNAVFRGIWVEETFDKGFIITGSGEGINTDAYLIKTDSIGNINWVKTFGGNGLDQGRCVKQLSDSGYVLLIRTTSFSLTNGILLIKTDSNGNEIWRKYFIDSSNHLWGNEIQIINNSGFVIAGWRSVEGQDKMYLLRLDNNGDTTWTKVYNSYIYSRAFSIDLTEDNGFIIGGIADTTLNNYPTAYIIKSDLNGTIEWQRRYSSSYKEFCFSIRSMPDKRYAFCGMSDSTFFNYERAILRVIDASGNILIEKYFRAGTMQNSFQSIEINNNMGFIMCGLALNTGGIGFSYIVNTDSLGNIKPVGINNLNEYVSDFKIEQNYPNPFNPQSIINYTLLKPASIKINLYDISGKYITTLINDFKPKGNYKFLFDPQKLNLSSGIYFYKSVFTMDGKNKSNSITKKMLYIK